MTSTAVTLALAPLGRRASYRRHDGLQVRKTLIIYILYAPARWWRDGVSRLASDVTATVCRLSVSSRPKLVSTERSFRYDSRILTAATVAACCTLLSGCVSSTPLGKCVGLNGHEDPALTYEYSVQNIFVGVAFVELIYPPIKVALDELKCPTGRTGRAR